MFTDKRRKKDGDKDQLIAELYQQVGQLTMELDWLKKSLSLRVDDRRGLIERDHSHLSLSRQAALLGISRSSLYYAPRVDPYDVELMGLIDAIYTEFPYYGSRKIQEQLGVDGHRVCRERVQRLMRQMGIRSGAATSPTSG